MIQKYRDIIHDINTIVGLIYGNGGVGKTLTALAFENYSKVFYWGFGGKDMLKKSGYNGNAETGFVNDFEEFKNDFADLLHMIETGITDTVIIEGVDMFLKLISKHYSNDSHLANEYKKLTQAGYAMLNSDFEKFIDELKKAKVKNILFICHGKESFEGKITPDVPGNPYKELVNAKTHFFCYMKKEDDIRTLLFDSKGGVLAKGITELKEIEVPEKSTPEHTDFMNRIFQTHRKFYNEQSEETKAKDILIEKSKKVLSEITTIAGLCGLDNEIMGLDTLITEKLRDLYLKEDKEGKINIIEYIQNNKEDLIPKIEGIKTIIDREGREKIEKENPLTVLEMAENVRTFNQLLDRLNNEKNFVIDFEKVKEIAKGKGYDWVEERNKAKVRK